jgi:hypothetical protein
MFYVLLKILILEQILPLLLQPLQLNYTHLLFIKIESRRPYNFRSFCYFNAPSLAVF